MNAPILLNNADFLNVEREYCRRSLRNFVHRAWPILEPATKLEWGWPLDAICEHLEGVSFGDITRLLVNVPPGCMKSLLTSVLFPAWEWGPREMPHLRFLGTSHKLDLAVRDNLKMRRLVKSEWYQSLWPTPLMTDQDVKTKFENTKTGFREAMAFTSMTGSRGHRVGCDDPLSVDQAESDMELEAVEKTFTEALPTRLNNQDTSAIIVIMQRLHERDPSGIIKDLGLPYVHLMLPMRFEADRRCTTVFGGRTFVDPRTEDGELLLPSLFSERAVRELETSFGGAEGHASAGQLQQRPSPRGGGLFKAEWFVGKMIKQEDVPSTKMTWCRGWDFASTKGKRSAWTAGAKLGLHRDGRIIIANVRRKRGTPQEVERLLVGTAKMDGRMVRGSIPKDPGQAGDAQRDYLIKVLKGYRYRASPETGSKETRAGPLASQAEVGNVYYVEGAWNKDFFAELETFPVGRFKDQVDAASRAFADLTSRSSYNLDGL